MSRIRSIHPGLWTDERFVCVSPIARLFFMGIWNECDDLGSFEWAPLKLKMRLLPADAADAAELLSELEQAGSVMRYEIAGKAYGAVRNFCQYQRPKKPNSTYPQTDEVRNWVNTEARSTRDGGEVVGKELPTEPEKSRQRKDEGDKKESSEAKASSPRAWALPTGVALQVWQDFKRNRERKRLPNTETAWKTFNDDLKRISNQTGIPPPKLIEIAAAKGWASINDPNERTQRHERTDNPTALAVQRLTGAVGSHH